MGEAKFTKGPWSIRYTGMHWNNPKLSNIEINFGNDNECICDTVYEEADAYLIAAAPDLHDRLEESIDCMVALISTLESQGFDSSDLKRQIADNRYFLSKARGETE